MINEDIDDIDDLDLDGDEIQDVEDIEIEDVEDSKNYVENLISLIRKMISFSNFDKYFVFQDDDNSINVEIILNSMEKISNIMKAMNIFKKLESDTLIEYDSEFELWETKQGNPIFICKFYYNPGISKKTENVPF